MTDRRPQLLTSRWPQAAVLLGFGLLIAGCTQDMYDQGRYDPLEASPFFADGRSARPLEPGVIARGSLREGEPIGTGRQAGESLTEIPVEVTLPLLERGRNRFNIFCTPCHGLVGNGDGMIVERGFRRPPSYHIDRLRGAPPGYFFDVITNGFGAMPGFKDRISIDDRWAIVAFVRALQLSQHATPDDLTSSEREQLEQEQLENSRNTNDTGTPP